MHKSSQKKIFLSDDRGRIQNDLYRSYSTFNFGKYFNQHKTAYNNLYVLNDDTLAPYHSADFEVEETSYIIILPVVGSVKCTLSSLNTYTITAGRLFILPAPANTKITLQNPLNNDMVNFIQLWIKTDALDNTLLPQAYNFDLDEYKNQLIHVTNSQPSGVGMPVISIGKFTGRHKAKYTNNCYNPLFTFVIQGAFEVQDCLLHARDGLGLHQLNEVELEALSNDAIILMIELQRL